MLQPLLLCQTQLVYFSRDVGFQVLSSLSTTTSSTVGGALIVNGSDLTLDNCSFKDNTASIGGAIFSERESNITIRHSTFAFNHVRSCGNGLCYGGVLFIDTSGRANISNCTFYNNTSDGYGGVAAIFSADLSISQSNVYNSEALYGGMIAALQGSLLSLDTVTLNGSRADIDGGTVYLSGSKAVINSSLFVGGSAERMGGVITADSQSTITLNDGYFIQNSASTGGVLSSVSSNATITNSVFRDNEAEETGGVFQWRKLL